ncbi:MAG: PAS domain S-box protein, partial [Deltaproteobacteria bacterium]|nr:PAS domain S-box protein [Deltaproteobacteria bacterium]
MTIATKRKDNPEGLAGDKYFNLIEHAADGIAIIQDGVFKLVNTALARISGYDKEELLGMPFTKLLTPESQKLTVARYQARLAGKKVPAVYEIKAITKDGEIRDIEINAALTEYDGRAADEVIIRNINEHKQAEKIQSVSEEDYQLLFDLMPIGVTMLDMKGVILHCNPAVYNMGSYAEGEFTGKHFSKIASIRAKDIPTYIRVFNSIVRGKTPKPFETTYQRKDGTTGWIELHIGLLRVGGKRRILVMQHDITERKQIEEALNKSERQASAAIEAAKALTFNYDIATGKIEWGGAIEEITGYTEEEFAKVDADGWAERIHPDDRDEILSTLQEAMGKDRATAEYRFKTKKGYVALSSISLTEKQDGKAVSLVGILQDITERKQAEE